MIQVLRDSYDMQRLIFGALVVAIFLLIAQSFLMVEIIERYFNLPKRPETPENEGNPRHIEVEKLGVPETDEARRVREAASSSGG